MSGERSWPRLPARVYMLLLAAGVILPLLALALLLGQRTIAAERARSEEAVASTAEAVRSTIDRELAGLVETLQALAASPALQQGQFRQFYEQARNVAEAQGLAIGLRNTSGQQLLFTGEPFDRPPSSSRINPWNETLLRTRQPLVTDLYVGLTSHEPQFAVVLPVIQEQEVRWFLHLAVPPARLAAVLRSLGLQPGWRAALVDGQGLVLARSERHAEAVGQPTVVPFRYPDRAASLLRDREGRMVYAVARPLGNARWVVVTSVPAEMVDGPLKRDLDIILGTAAALVGLALLIAAWFGGRLGETIRSLGAAAEALMRNQPVPPIGSGVREIAEVGMALAEASTRLQQEAERQRLIGHELNHRVKNTLASIQALATLTAREAPDVATYRQRLSERLDGLARTQALLTQAGWEATRLHALMDAELGMHRSDGTARVLLEGPDLTLAATQVIPLGMLLHELVTNSSKYGALSVPHGLVQVGWQARDGRLLLRWTESGGPPVQVPVTPGFGTRLIERGLARQLHAAVRSDYRPEGLVFSLEMPLA